MSLKSCLDSWINRNYFKLLLRRHVSLGLISLGVFFSLLFLFAILDFEMESLIVFLIPYSLIIVPLTALVLFKTYTRKGDLAYLASIPLTRRQLFTTTYLVGLTIIELTLLIMTTITFFEYGSDLIRSVIAFLALGIIYYTLACLGCMFGSKTITQFINMGIICFGPVSLYLISKGCINEIAFGHFTTSYNDSLLMVICPLISGAEFLSGDGWPYWWAHILLIIGTFSLNVYLVRNRHFESEKIESLTKWILKPVIYLNITYVLFLVCFLTTIGNYYHYDLPFYIKTIVLLIGVSILVACLMSIWTSKNINMIIKKDNVLYQFCLIIVSCVLMIVPLWQTENQRYQNLDEVCTVTFVPPNNYWYEVLVSKEEAQHILKTLDNHRSLIVNRDDYNSVSKEAYIMFDGQKYMFNLDEINQPLIDVCETILIRARESDSLWYDFGTPLQGYDILRHNSRIYKKENVVLAHQATYEEKLTKEFLEKLIIDWQVGNDYDQFYPLTFTSMSYNQWKELIFQETEALFEEEQWNEICDCVMYALENTESIKVTSKYANDIMKKSGSIKYDSNDYWLIVDANSDYVKIRVGVWLYMIDDYENEDITLFKDSDASLCFEYELNRENNQWVPTLTGVYYR